MQRNLAEEAERPAVPPTAPIYDLNSPGTTKAIAERLKRDIDEYAIQAYYEPHRWHLGASLIGHACSRYLWYVFRWAGTEPPDGRKLRLLNRGHREEARFIEFIEGIGGKIWTCDTNAPLNEKGEHPQFRMSAVKGHFGGSLDGVMILPKRYGVKDPMLSEFKTNNTGRGFNDVREKQVMLAKPMHWAQICTYGNAYKLTHVGYFIVNKNDDDLEIQVQKIDWRMGEHMLAKAERIIGSTTPPPKLSESPTFLDCTWCAMKAVCHQKAEPEFNCRSCKNASPIDNGEWFCNHHGAVIPRDYVTKGCDKYKPIG